MLRNDAKNLLGGNANKATSILGSYTAHYQVLRASPRGIQVRITVGNNMSVSSLSHYATGYGTRMEKFLVSHIDNDGIIALHHSMQSHYMTITWREVIPVSQAG